MRNTSDGNQLALLYIAQEGPSIAYQVYRKTPLGRSLTYKILKEMESKGWLKSKKIGKSNAGLNKNAYSLTIMGLIQALYIVSRRDKRLIIDRWANLIPLVLEKWAYFLKAGVEDLAYFRLDWACRAFVGNWMPMESSTWRVPYREDLLSREHARFQNYAELFTYYFYDPWITYERYDPFREIKNQKNQQKWAEACLRDPEIRNYITEELKFFLEKNEHSANEAESMMEELRLKSPST